MLGRGWAVQSQHTVTLTNDTGESMTIEAFVFGAYDETYQNLGEVASQASVAFNLPVGAGQYDFYGTAHTAQGTAYAESSITEEKLIERNFNIKFVADNMMLGAYDPLAPTPTLEPEIPTPTACPGGPCP
jgi:hypothetical protein